MWIQFRNWLHHLFEPHCPDCVEQRLRDKECGNCEVLRYLLEREKAEKLKLIEFITYREVPVERELGEVTKSISRARPWRMIQAELEASSRAEAARRKAAAETSPEISSVSSIDELEEVAGVKENG